MSRRAVVVGAGMAGLASAALLAREGYAVTVLESRSEVGGRAARWEHEGFRFDTGPSWYLMPEVFDHFFRLLGTSAAEQLSLERLDPAYRVFFEQHPPMDVRSDRASAIAQFESVEPGAGARLAGYLDSAEQVYELAKQYFLYTTFASLRPLLTPPVLARLPQLARLLTESLEHRVAREFDDTRLRQVLGYPAVFLGSSPALTPSMYHLMSHLDLADGVRYPRGGIGAVVDAVAAQVDHHGGTVVLDATVERITVAPRRSARRAARMGLRARATGVDYRDAAGEVRHLAADLVVSTADLHHTETALLPPRLRTYPERWWRRRTPGPSAVMVYLGVAGALPELEHHSLFFTEDWQAGFERIFAGRDGRPLPPFPELASLYVSRPSATDEAVAPAGSEALIILVPVPAEPTAGRGGHDRAGDPWVEAVADAAIDQVSAWAGIPDLRERTRLRRTLGPGDYAAELSAWRGTALGPAHTLRQSAMFRAGNRSRRVDGLFYAGGSVIPGIGLPMCLISAEILLKRLRRDHSTTALPEPR